MIKDLIPSLTQAMSFFGKSERALARVKSDVATVRSNVGSLVRTTDHELALHPGFPVVLVDPSGLATLGERIDRETYVTFELFMWIAARSGINIQNPYAAAIEEQLPARALMLLNQEDRVCTIYSPGICGTAAAGIKYDEGSLQAVPVSTDRFPIEDYQLAGANELHRLGTVVGGGYTQWTGRYFASHFVIGLILNELYPGNTDMITIGQPHFDTSKGHLPHTHYRKLQPDSSLLEERVRKE